MTLDSEYFDWDARPISPEEFFAILRTRGRQVADDTIGAYRVSTVWLGYRPKEMPYTVTPMIFETMVFTPVGISDDVYWYATHEEALEGHASACLRVASLAEGEST